MQYPKIPLAQTIVQLCKAKSIKHIIISPGSRNAPLTIGFTNDNYFTCYSIVDERCAAFFALGIAQKLQQPTAVVCTSGSAMLNYYPAVAEAFYSDIPLVVLSADRPKYLISIGDGQTINQPDVYKNHILYSTNLKQDLGNSKNQAKEHESSIIENLENKLERFLEIEHKIQEENEEEINRALNIAIHKKGPVHINIPFDEPLYETTDTLSVNPKVISVKIQPKPIDFDDIESYSKTWSDASKKIVLVGVNQLGSVEQIYLNKLANDDSIIVFIETTSNLHHPEFFPSIDKMIAPFSDEEFKQLQPDILLTFGGLIVSKKVKAFLRTFKPKHHWHIDEKKANDTFFCLEKHFETSPNKFFEEFLPRVMTNNSSFKPFFKTLKRHREEKHQEYIKQIPFCDFKVFDSVLKSIPNNTSLQISNSSAIRYAQLFNLNKTLEIHCNRGTSGIDGSMSTAIGFAVSNTNQTTFITGDLSFFYDSNALWNNYIPSNFRIIVVNNSGGGIFRILPGDKNSKNFDTFFETKHKLTAIQLCKMYGFNYSKAEVEDELNLMLNSFFIESDSPKLLEVFTPNEINDEVLLNYFKFIK